MSGSVLVALGLLTLAGFLVGGVVAFGRERRVVPAAILGVLAALAVAASVLRLV